MKLGIMQPYFFPYLGYFSLIKYTDRWVVFDAVQYIRHGWVNRNRILHPTDGWQYVVAPLSKFSRDAKIREIHTLPGHEWRDKMVRQLDHYRKRAPFFARTRDFVASCLATAETSLSKLNASIVSATCQLLGIPFNWAFYDDLHLDIGEVDHPGKWALLISEKLGASEYVNPPGGRELFDPLAFRERGIDLKFLSLSPHSYDQRRPEFIFGLSIIDALMFNSPAEVLGLVGNFEVS